MNTRDVVFIVAIVICAFMIAVLSVTSYVLFDVTLTQREEMDRLSREGLKLLDAEREKNKRMRDYISRTKRVDRD